MRLLLQELQMSSAKKSPQILREISLHHQTDGGSDFLIQRIAHKLLQSLNVLILRLILMT